MSFIQISFPIHSQEAEISEDVLNSLGALAVMFEDAQDQPILEPGVGETPLWNEAVIKALFPEETDCMSLLAGLAEGLPLLDLELINFELLKDQAWERAWMIDFKPMSFGKNKNFWIVPSNIQAPEDHLAIILDPGLAFGTGTHPTTKMCLDYLADIDCKNKIIIDFGCGSGILALAALKLGAQKLIAIDNDPQALIATQDNAERNNLLSENLLILNSADIVSPLAGDTGLKMKLGEREAALAAVDILIANILAAPLVQLAELFSSLVKPKGLIALSGILNTQTQDILKAYEPYFEDLKICTEGDWVRVDGKRK